MDRAGFGILVGGGVVSDVPDRWFARVARRLLTLVGLAFGSRLIGLALHAGSADAAPSGTPRPPGPAGPAAPVRPAGGAGVAVRHSGDAVGTVVHAATAHATTGRTAPAAAGEQAARRNVAPVVHGLEHGAVQHRPATARVARQVVNRGVDAVQGAAVHPVRNAGRVSTVGGSDPARGAAAVGAGSARPRSGRPGAPVVSGPVVFVTCCAVTALSWPLDTVPTSPYSPQPLPFSPGGSVAVGGTVPSGHENAAMPPVGRATGGARGRPVVACVDVTPPGGRAARPGVSPD